MLGVRGMTLVASALVALASVLGAWALVSVLATPMLVVCVRAQQRANARRTARLQREGWSSRAAR